LPEDAGDELRMVERGDMPAFSPQAAGKVPVRISRAAAPVWARSMRIASYQALPQAASVSFTRFTISSCAGAGSAWIATVFFPASGAK
jgi:hypothetical protein